MKIESIKKCQRTMPSGLETVPSWLITATDGSTYGAYAASNNSDVRLIAALCERDAEARAIIQSFEQAKEEEIQSFATWKTWKARMQRARAWLGEATNGKDGEP